MHEIQDNKQIIEIRLPKRKPYKRYNIDSSNAKKYSLMGTKSPHIGKRGKSKTTLTKEEALKAVQQKIIERSMKLNNAQTMLGLGTIKVFRQDAHWEYFGKTRKLVKEKPRIVEDEDEIINVLDYEYGDGEDPSTPDGVIPKFYFVEIKEPNNSAIESQFNRLFGKPKESVDVTSNGKSVAPVIVGMQIIDKSNDIKQVDAEVINNDQFIESGTTETA